MPLPKFDVPPDNSSYTVDDGLEVISAKLDGGLPRLRRDILKSSSGVSVVWKFTRVQYLYFRYFYKTIVNSGSDPFLIDLIIDSYNLTEHEVTFVPGSVKLTGQQGLAFFVSAQLEAKQVPLTADEILIAQLYDQYGELWADYYP